jgi:hypothetical protein
MRTCSCHGRCFRVWEQPPALCAAIRAWTRLTALRRGSLRRRSRAKAGEPDCRELEPHWRVAQKAGWASAVGVRANVFDSRRHDPLRC